MPALTTAQVRRRAFAEDAREVAKLWSAQNQAAVSEEVGSTKDHVSGKRVRLVEVRP